jgi:methylthioribose-1-phosphate isomerase
MSNGGSLPRHWLLRSLEIETDRAHGSGRLAREALRAFRDALEEAWTPEADPDAVRAQLEAYAGRLRRAQPGLASLGAMLDRSVAALKNGREAALAETEAVLQEARGAGQALIQAADALLRPGTRVITHGHSETVQELLTHYADRLENVTVCESRPLNAGVRLAAALASLALPARLITEAQLELFVPECDLALAGAERVLPGGDVVSTVGTAVFARVCAAHRVPFYVTAERGKWIAEGHELARFTRERRAPSEVLQEPPRGVQVVNIAFDRTPAALVSGYVTEDGLQGKK